MRESEREREREEERDSECEKLRKGGNSHNMKIILLILIDFRIKKTICLLGWEGGEREKERVGVGEKGNMEYFNKPD